MTRINVLPVETLLNEHLIAEWRELPRIPNELIKHPTRLQLSKIPNDYVLGTGHVQFFRDKLLYLVERHKLLCDEMDKRQIKRDPLVRVPIADFNSVMLSYGMNTYKPTENSLQLNTGRIMERFNLRKKSYHFTKDNIKHTINCEISFNKYLCDIGHSNS